MNTLTIGVDLDGVCAKYNDSLRKYVAKHSNHPVESLPEPEFYSFVRSGWPLKDEAEYCLVHGNAVEAGIYRELEPIKGASKVLHELSRAGNHLRVITSRFVNPGQHSIVCSDTVSWLDQAVDAESFENIKDEAGNQLSYREAKAAGHTPIPRVPYSDIVFSGLKQEMFADVYIDDSPSNIFKLNQATESRVLIFNTAYNKTHDTYGDLDQYGERVYGWDEDSLDAEGQAILDNTGKMPLTVKEALNV